MLVSAFTPMKIDDYGKPGSRKRWSKMGMQVYIEGKIRTYKWKDKEGNEITDKKIRATSMTMINSVNRKNDDAPNLQADLSKSGETSNTNLTDDLPF